MATKVCVLCVRVFEPVRFLKDRGWHQSKKEHAIRNDSDLQFPTCKSKKNSKVNTTCYLAQSASGSTNFQFS